MRLIALFVLALFAASAAAAPSVSGVSGTVAQGNTLTISGSGFGTKNPAKPYLWAPFESGSANPSPLGLTTTWYPDSMDYAAGEGYGGTGALKATNSSGVWTAYVNANGFAWNGWDQKVYMFRRLKQNFAITSDLNWKILRIWGADFTYPDFYMQAGNGNVVTEGVADSVSWMDHLDKMSVIQGSPNVWQLGEMEYRSNSAASLPDGEWRYWVNGELVAYLPHFTYTNRYFKLRDGTSEGSGPMVMFFVVHGVKANVTFPSDYRHWADDVYLDTTWARVVIGNASTLSGSTHREIQIPMSWSDTSISVSTNLTAWPGGTKYLFVVDASGVASGGYALTGGGGTTYTVTPSAGANGSISPSTAQTVTENSTTAFTVTPNGGYTASVGGTCGGSLSGTVYTTNAIVTNCTVSATFSPVADTAPPVISAPLPTGEQPYGTASVTLQVTTNENATCKYHATDVAYGSMGSTFASTGGTTHQQTGFATSNGSSYARYVRCIDGSGNANTASTTLAFSIAATNDITLDNGGAGTSNSGSWWSSTYFPGFYGSDYVYALAETGHWYQWTTSLTPGTYAVYASWPAVSSRPPDVTYQITHSGGTANVTADQTASAGQWNLLGTYSFGSTATVRLLSSANGSEGTAADAIRFSASAVDATSPVLSGLSPTGDQATPGTSITLALTTDENATCRYDLNGVSDYDLMSNYTTTGGTSHSATVTVRKGGIYAPAAKCRDAAGNTSASPAWRFAIPDDPKRRLMQ